eukprot:NODE_27_length_33950_cov_0.349739.p6 type:complete len:582 gc:universal NODE_27_length_33950_cov_0.349739:27402-29147(+)
MSTTIGGLTSKLTDDPKRIMKEINNVKKNKQYNKLSGLYNMLSQVNQGPSSVSALEKAKKYHGYCDPLDAINTYLNYADLNICDNTLQAKIDLDLAQGYLGKLDKKTRVEKIIDLCDLYLKIGSPLDVLDLTRMVKRADDASMFSLLLLKSRAYRQEQRFQNALEVISEMDSLISISRQAVNRCKILGEMAKIYCMMGDYDNESRLKTQYYDLKNKEEVHISDDSLSSLSVAENQTVTEFNIIVKIHHKCVFLQIDEILIAVDSNMSHSAIKERVLHELTAKLKIPRLVIKKFILPKSLISNNKAEVWLSNSSLPTLSSLYKSVANPVNKTFASILGNINNSLTKVDLSYLRLKDSDYTFVHEYLPANLSTLNISHNFLTGVSGIFDKFKQLRELDVSNNCLSGPLNISSVSANITCWKSANILEISDKTMQIVMDLATFVLPSALDALGDSNIVKLSARESKFTRESYFNLKSGLRRMRHLKDLDLSGLIIDDPIALDCIPCTVTNLALDLTVFTDICDYHLRSENLSVLSLKTCVFYGNSESLLVSQIMNLNVRCVLLNDSALSKPNLELLEKRMLVIR